MKSRAWGLGLLLLMLAVIISVLAAGWWRAVQQQAPRPSPVDIGFSQAMSRHHQQAIGMAQLMLDGRPTPLAALARQIATAQLLELGEMQGWLKLWGAPLMPLKPPMDWMLLGRTPPDDALRQYLLDCAATPTGMSGLATEAEVGRLRTLQGRERDAHFLTLMRAHHEGGLPMARFATVEAKLPVVRRLAANVVREQMHELMIIRRTHAALEAVMAAETGTTIPAPNAMEEKPTP